METEGGGEGGVGVEGGEWRGKQVEGTLRSDGNLLLCSLVCRPPPRHFLVSSFIN